VPPPKIQPMKVSPPPAPPKQTGQFPSSVKKVGGLMFPTGPLPT
jgi:hypothetical protein